MLQHHHLLQAAIILFSLTWKGSLASADLQYEACRVPKSCGSGPNISYPFYILGLQESFCGYPGFALNCSQDGLPMLNLLENDYVVRDIDYANSSIRVYDASVSSGSDQVYSSCQRIFRNTTINPTSLFPYAIGNSNITKLHLFSGCSALSQKINLSSYTVWCNYSGEYISDFTPDCSGVNCTAIQPQLRYGKYVDGSIIGIIAMYDKDENLKDAQDKCNTSAVKTVERLKIFSGNYNAATALEETLRSGIELNWTASDCRPCIASGGHCGFDYNFYQFKCFCEGGPHSRSCPIADKHRITGLTLAAGLTAVVVAALIALFLILYIRRKINKRSPARNNKNMELFLKNHGEVSPKRFKYSQLKKMTHKFKDNLGKGGYGSVYKGTTLDDSRLVAVKVLDHTKGNGDEFLNEVACISRTSHVNIVTLLGYCLEGSRRALVYEYMPNGSLDKFIQDSSSLNWEKLCDIAVGIARGLEYLHQGCSIRILHFDIKPHNVLLDKDLRPKISDFGLAKLCPERVSIVSMSGTRGTIGYIAPELFSRFFGTVSYKSDVYSYGMMVLEMVGERVNNNGRRREKNDCTSSSDMYFPHWIYKNIEVNFKDDEIDDDECRLIKRKLTIVGLWCIQNDSKDRPSMTKVVEMLEGDVKLLQIPPKPCLSSTTGELQDVCTSASGVTSAFDENII